MNFGRCALAVFFAFAGILISFMMGPAAGGSFAQENQNQTPSQSASQVTDNPSSMSFSSSNFTTAGNTSSPLATTNDNTTVSTTTDSNTMQNGSAKEASGPLDPIVNLFK